MTDQWTDAEKEQFFAPGMDDSEYQPPPPDEDTTEEYTSLFDAPDYATFVKPEQTKRSKDYEQKVKSVLKATALAAFRNGYVADGATILHYGPSFAKTCGDLTDVSDGAAKAIDMITTPDNPWVVFAFAAIPFAFQFVRNHEQTAEQVQQGWRAARKERKAAKARGEIPLKREGTPIQIKLPFGKQFTIRVHLPRPASFVKAFHAQTHDPRTLTHHVLSDVKLRRVLEEQGIKFMVRRDAQH